MVVSFVIGCVSHSFQNLSECVFFLLLWIFDLSLPVGDMFFWSDDKWNCHVVIGLR